MISIIVPAYNGEKYIPRLFNCFKAQTSYEFEVIIVDDGSVDSTLAVARKEAAKCSFPCQVIGQINGGVSRARNTGLEHVKGDYVMFVDVDDLITDDRVEYLAVLANKTDADVILSGSKTVPDYDINSEATAPIHQSGDSYQIYNTDEILSAFLSEKVHTGVWGGVFSRRMIEANHLRFAEDCKYSEDLHFMWRAFACSRIVCVSRKLTYLYMWVPNSAMSKFNENRLQGYKRIKDLSSFMEEHVPVFAPTFKKYAAARILWSIIRQASCVFSYKEFMEYHKNEDVRSEMQSLLSYDNTLVRLSALIYIIHPFMFYFVARAEGRKRIHQ